MQRPLDYPVWKPEMVPDLLRSTITDMQLVTKPRRHYCVTHEWRKDMGEWDDYSSMRVAYEDSPSKIVGATEAKDGLVWWGAGLAADYLLDHVDEVDYTLRMAAADGGGHAWKERRDQWYTEARKQHDVQKREAATKGSAVHDYIERCLKWYVQGGQRPLDPPEGIDQGVFQGIAAFGKWWDQAGLHPEGIEVPTCSVRHGYAGTIDVVAGDSYGDTVIVDWKTSSAVYGSHYRQVGAYYIAHEERTGDRASSAYIVRLSKETGEFAAHYLTRGELDWAADAFLKSLDLYRYTRHIEEVIRSNEQG